MEVTNSQQVLINALNGNTEFLVLSPDDFPLKPERDIYEAIKDHYLKTNSLINKSLFAQLLRADSESVSKYYSRFIMNGSPDESIVQEQFKIIKTDQFWDTVDDNIAELLNSARNRDLVSFKDYYQLLQAPDANLNRPKDIRLSNVETRQQTLIRPFINSIAENGFYFSGVNIIGAGSGAGKSIFVMEQALYTYKVLKKSVTYISLEMDEVTMLGRMYSSITGTPYSEVFGNPAMDRLINDWKLEFFSETECRFHIDCTAYTPSSLLGIVTEETHKGSSLIVVDYLQIISFSGKQEDWKELASLVKDLHNLTLAFGVVIISPVQVNIKEFSATGTTAYISVRGSAELINSSTSFLLAVNDKDAPKDTPLIKLFTIKARNAKNSLYVLGKSFHTMNYKDLFTVMD